ncbi:MAG: SipW-dependent-type signal peptide-containing protein [Chloroflexota bacterium]
MKTKILIIATLLVSIAMFSTGAYAYFTSSRTATSTVQTGTLGIKIASSPVVSSVPDDADFGETATPWVFDKMVPGESKSGCLWLMNTGNVGTVRARYDFTIVGTSIGGAPSTLNLADRLQLTTVYTSDNGYNWIDVMAHTAWDPNNDGIITLQEVSNYGGDWQNDVDPFVETAPGGKGAICMTFKMINGTPAEDNPFQGAQLNYTALVTAFNPAP